MYWGWWLPGTPPIPLPGMFVLVMEYRQPVFFSQAVIILSLRVSRGCDLECSVVDSVADGTLAA
jgi:hypothetical protein